MFKITMNKLYLTQGDTARFSIGLVDLPGVSQDYKLSSADSVYFIVTDSPKKIVSISSLANANSCIFYKEGTDILIEPSDTINLAQGVYYYQVRVVLAVSGDTSTIIEPTELYITPYDDDLVM